MTAAEPEILLFCVEACRKCDGRVLVHYVLDQDGLTGGWGGKPVGPCGNPSRCLEKVCGIDDTEAALLLHCRVAGVA